MAASKTDLAIVENTPTMLGMHPMRTRRRMQTNRSSGS